MVQTGCELEILLLQPTQCWDYVCTIALNCDLQTIGLSILCPPITKRKSVYYSFTILYMLV